MQQEVHSYAFQLKQQTTCSSLTSEPYQLGFYASVMAKTTPNAGYLYRLGYNQDNPRKSQLQTVAWRGQLKFVKAIGFGNEQAKVFLHAGAAGIKLVDQKVFEKAQLNTSELDSFNSTQTDVIDLQKGKDSTLFLINATQIKSVDPNKLAQPDTVVQVTDGRSISHCAIDPAKGFVTYNVQNQIIVYDRASKNQKFSFKASPRTQDTITNVDYNPNKQYCLMSSHYDYMKFWDIRKTSIPLRIVDQHHSLLLRALYNHAHDELLLGCYDDGAVGLYRMSSVSSSPSGEGSDALVKLYDEHEDSVYHACWGQSPWVFASVSYTASNLVVNIVPSVEKYRILL